MDKNNSNNSDSSNIIIINDKVIFNENIDCEENLLVKDCIGVNSGVYIEGDLNTNNQNCFGLLSSLGNIYSKGNVYISDNNSKFLSI